MIVGECGVGISSIFSPSHVIFSEEVVTARMVKIKYTIPAADMEELETRREDMEVDPVLNMEEEIHGRRSEEQAHEGGSEEQVPGGDLEEQAPRGGLEEAPLEDSILEEHRLPTLRRLFPPSHIEDPQGTPLVPFPPVIGDFQNLNDHPGLNDPQFMDLDAACFMMLTLDLPELFGSIARPGNRKVKVKDLEDFDDWLHVLSDPIVVKVYAGNGDAMREDFKDQLTKLLRIDYGLVLSCSNDALTLCRNQVNISVKAMSEALHRLGARICRVQFFGMKWGILVAEPKIDHFIDRYRDEMDDSVPFHHNIFDIGVAFNTNILTLFKFSDAQVLTGKYNERHVHEMFNIDGFGSVDFKPDIDNILKIKVYQELCHEILSVIHKQNLDDMPKTIFTVRTRLRQMVDLLAIWEGMSEDAREDHLLGYRLEITLRIETIEEGRLLCSSLDLLQLQGIESFLGGSFDIREVSIDIFLREFGLRLHTLAQEIHDSNENAPPVRVKTALTFARQALGWSGKNMKKQLRDARKWRDAQERQQARNQEGGYTYNGWEQDDEDMRPLIQDFMDNARWELHGKVKNRSLEGNMLRMTKSRQFWPRTDVYDTREEGARHFIGLFGANWREHVQSIS